MYIEIEMFHNDANDEVEKYVVELTWALNAGMSFGKLDIFTASFLILEWLEFFGSGEIEEVEGKEKRKEVPMLSLMLLPRI